MKINAITSTSTIVIGFILAVGLVFAAIAGALPMIITSLSVCAVFGGILFIYFLPSWCANENNKKNTHAIFALNTLVGWTVIGWIAVLVWGLIKD